MNKKRRAKTGGSPGYFFKEAVINLFLNGFMSFAAISIITICLLVVGCFTLTAMNAKNQIANEVEKSEILIFIEEDYLIDTIKEDLAELATKKTVTGEDVIDGLDDNLDDDEDLDEETDLDEDLEEELAEEVTQTNENLMNLEQIAYLNNFLNSAKDPQAYIEIEKSILQVIDVSGVTYTSKEQALENYKLELGEEAYILQGFENDNPLRDGYIVHLNSLEYVDDVVLGLNLIHGIAEVSSRNETYKALYNIEKGFNILAGTFLIAFGCVSIFIISNTVKLAMFARRDEISIMKMIGAKDAFIKWPFIIEGLILGLISAGFAYFVTWLIYIETIEFASEFIGFVSIIPFETIKMDVILSYLAIGMIVGVCGSLFTIRKFLDV